MVSPVKSMVEVYAEVSEGLDGRDVVSVTSQEGVSCTMDGQADKLGVCMLAGEGH